MKLGLVFGRSIGVLGAAAACACGADASSARSDEQAASETATTISAVDVNDVSVLFAQNRQDGSLFPDVKLSDALANATSDAAHDVIVPQSVFDGVMAFASTPSPTGVKRAIDLSAFQGDTGGAGDLSKWRVVGFRFDACARNTATAPSLTKLSSLSVADLKGPTCAAQLRLIAQPLVHTGGTILPEALNDYALHIIYTLGLGDVVGDRAAIIDDLLALKKTTTTAGFPTTNLPLGVHPALAARDATVGKAVQTFLSKHLKNTVTVTLGGTKVPLGLTNVAMMGLENKTLEPWAFFAGAVAKGASFSPLPIPVFADPSVVAQRFTVLGAPGIPAGTHLDPLSPSTVTSTARMFATSKSSQPPADDVTRDIHIVNNPERVDFFRTDCVSCHTATQRELDLSAPSNDSARSRFVPPPGITGYAARSTAQVGVWNTRNFGYFISTGPTVSLRAANETAEVASTVNRLRGQKNPGVSCAANEQALFECFTTGSRPAASCVAAICSQGRN